MSFLTGTYGFDLLSMFLLVLSILLNFNYYTRIVGIVLTLIVIFRAFSKNTYKRNAELVKFTTIVNKTLGKFGKRLPYPLPKVSLEAYELMFRQLKILWNQKRQYNKQFKIVKCPNCKQKLRLPRGQNRIIVKCKRCSHEFKMRT